MARPAPADDGSPARLIVTMVGIVGILLLGSLAWSAVGALLGALGEATAVFSSARPTAVKLVAAAGTATGTPMPQVTTRPTETPVPTASATPTLEPTAEPTLALTPTPAAAGRSPWILLPQPAPDSRVPPGALVVEVRGRGDAPITAIRLELDGASLPVSLEQRSESTWRGSATTQVAAGHHSVRATVTDDQNRTGSYRWAFDAG